MKTYQVPTTKERKPILYWIAVDRGNQIDQNNSIAILRAKYGSSVQYRAIR